MSVIKSMANKKKSYFQITSVQEVSDPDITSPINEFEAITDASSIISDETSSINLNTTTGCIANHHSPNNTTISNLPCSTITMTTSPPCVTSSSVNPCRFKIIKIPQGPYKRDRWTCMDIPESTEGETASGNSSASSSLYMTPFDAFTSSQHSVISDCLVRKSSSENISVATSNFAPMNRPTSISALDAVSQSVTLSKPLITSASLPPPPCSFDHNLVEQHLVDAFNKPQFTLDKFTASIMDVKIENKIEQALDIVKKHLKTSIQEDLDMLRERIIILTESITRLEYENNFLKAHATPETLSVMSKIFYPKSCNRSLVFPPSSNSAPALASNTKNYVNKVSSFSNFPLFSSSMTSVLPQNPVAKTPPLATFFIPSSSENVQLNFSNSLSTATPCLSNKFLTEINHMLTNPSTTSNMIKTSTLKNSINSNNRLLYPVSKSEDSAASATTIH